MTMIQLYLLQSLKIPMKSRLMKYFIALNMVIVLLLSSTYSSGLASVMTVPRYGTTFKFDARQSGIVDIRKRSKL
jgi:hypothetical protein